jgi:hypothetical protein
VHPEVDDPDVDASLESVPSLPVSMCPPHEQTNKEPTTTLQAAGVVILG